MLIISYNYILCNQLYFLYKIYFLNRQDICYLSYFLHLPPKTRICLIALQYMLFLHLCSAKRFSKFATQKRQLLRCLLRSFYINFLSLRCLKNPSMPFSASSYVASKSCVYHGSAISLFEPAKDRHLNILCSGSPANIRLRLRIFASSIPII